MTTTPDEAVEALVSFIQQYSWNVGTDDTQVRAELDVFAAAAREQVAREQVAGEERRRIETELRHLWMEFLVAGHDKLAYRAGAGLIRDVLQIVGAAGSVVPTEPVADELFPGGPTVCEVCRRADGGHERGCLTQFVLPVVPAETEPADPWDTTPPGVRTCPACWHDGTSDEMCPVHGAEYEARAAALGDGA